MDFGASSSVVQPSSELLVQNGIIFGSTYYGGSAGLGTIYSYDLATGVQTTLHEFKGNGPRKYDGTNPNSGMIAVGPLFYGTCAGGGNNNSYGTIFSFDPATGKEKTVYRFNTPQDAYSGEPIGPLVHLDGALYGVATFGGNNGNGVVFRYDIASGTGAAIYSFNTTTDGFAPQYGLTYDHGMLYGVLSYGGTKYKGTVFAVNPKTGAETVLHQFDGGRGGGIPNSRVTVLKGRIYGTLYSSGGHDKGAVYEITIATGRERLATKFPGGDASGAAPFGTMAAVGGTLYGTTATGGIGGDENGNGTIFQISR